jgi:HTH-type transcriptional regulator, competence development regulator
MLGEKLKELWESKGLLQRQVASELDVDSAYISKMENNDKPVSKEHLKKISTLLEVPEDDLLTLWVGEKVEREIKNETFGKHGLEIVLKELNNG